MSIDLEAIVDPLQPAIGGHQDDRPLPPQRLTQITLRHLASGETFMAAVIRMCAR